MFTEIDMLRKKQHKRFKGETLLATMMMLLTSTHQQYTKATFENNQTNTTMTRWLATLHGLEEGQGNLPLISLGLEGRWFQPIWNILVKLDHFPK